jgi:hypothetical protein
VSGDACNMIMPSSIVTIMQVGRIYKWVVTRDCIDEVNTVQVKKVQAVPEVSRLDCER